MAIGRLALVVALAMALGACEADAPVVQAVDPSGTALQPLPPDPAFEEAGRKVCLIGGELGNHVQLMPLVVQDRRRDEMAYLLFSNGAVTVDCLLERRGFEYEIQSGSTGPAPQPAQELSIDSTATVGERGFIVTGSVPAPVVAVVVQRVDGVPFQASLVEGRFVAWWTVGGDAATVIGYGADGREIGRTTPPRF